MLKSSAVMFTLHYGFYLWRKGFILAFLEVFPRLNTQTFLGALSLVGSALNPLAPQTLSCVSPHFCFFLISTLIIKTVAANFPGNKLEQSIKPYVKNWDLQAKLKHTIFRKNMKIH